MKTFSLKSADVKQDWYLVDAEGKTLGRLATQIARLLSGKDKPSYSPNVVCGDIVVVINSSKVSVTGQKMTDKFYYHHTGYPGGIRDISLKDQLIKDPNKVIEHAVSGMLPKNKLQPLMLKNLKVYPGTDHPHDPQKPKLITMESK
ncbi:MAG: 50S ribosomal protein L13 [Candidatus Saccharibacteria bacterium]